MKKILLSILALVVAGVAVTARDKDKASRQPDYKFELNIGCATYPVVDMSVSDHLFTCRPDIFYTDENASAISWLYSDYRGRSYLVGLFSAGFSYRFNKWISISAQANFDAVLSHKYSAITGKAVSTCNDYLTSALAYARFTYCNKPKVYLYSAVGAGAGLYFINDGIDEVIPEFQLAPLGVIVGKKVYGLFELGVGTVYCGLKVGLGYRF